MKIAVIYWSQTGNTQAMAENIANGIKEAGAEAEVIEVSDAPANLSEYDKVAFGCPAMGDEVLEEDVFEPYFASIEGELAGKSIALFGSYGWGDGQWMRDWQERASNAGANVFEEGFIAQDAADESECVEFGKRFAA